MTRHRRDAARWDDAPQASRPIGTWATIGHRWYVFAVAVVGYAIVQLLLVLPNATPAPTPEFLALVAVGVVFDIAVVAVALVTASAAARGLGILEMLRPHTARRIATVVAWSTLWVAAISLVGVVSAILSVIVVLIGAAVMPAIVAGRGLRAWFRPLRWVPGRTFVWGAVAYVLIIIAAVIDAELGFLVGEPLATALTRIESGAINVYIVCSAMVLAEWAELRRPAPAPPSSEQPPGSPIAPTPRRRLRTRAVRNSA